MVRALDEGVGQILQAVREAGIEDNTLIVFTSDNGGEVFSDMGGLAGSKERLWEGGIRVPAIACWPDVLPAGVVSDQVLISTDWTATFLAVAGASPSPEFPLDGIDLMPLMTGAIPAVERTLFWRQTMARQHGAVRSGDWKYLRTQGGAREHLFDLSADPGERHNLRDDHPDRFAALKAQYAAWEAEMLEPIFPGG